MTRTEKKLLNSAEHELKMAISEEDRYLGSVFANSIGQRRYEERVAAAYKNYRRLGGEKDI